MALKARAVRRARRPIIPAGLAHRVPPGQVIATRWPVLHQGDVPPFDPATWDLRVWGLVDAATSWTWAEWQAADRHDRCGSALCDALVIARAHVDRRVRTRPVRSGRAWVRRLASWCFTARVGTRPISRSSDFLDRQVVLATHHDGEPLTPEHGAPLRAVVPDRYAWKSVKWLRGVEFLAEDRPGFWESFGYSNSADPWREERFEPE